MGWRSTDEPFIDAAKSWWLHYLDLSSSQEIGGGGTDANWPGSCWKVVLEKKSEVRRNNVVLWLANVLGQSVASLPRSFTPKSFLLLSSCHHHMRFYLALVVLVLHDVLTTQCLLERPRKLLVVATVVQTALAAARWV